MQKKRVVMHVEEVAEALGVSRRTVERRIERGELVRVSPGRVSTESFERYCRGEAQADGKKRK